MPSYRNWIKQAQFHKTDRGVRLNLRIYVYPDGHGNFQHISPDGTVHEESHPVSDVGGAIKVFVALWKSAQSRKK